MDEGEDDPMDEEDEEEGEDEEEEEEDDEYKTPPAAAAAAAAAAGAAATSGEAAQNKPVAKRMRRRGVIYCRHGCGFKFVSQNAQGNKKGPADRKLRDQFDYHEQQQCPMLPRLVCPLECQYRGKVLSFAGPKALRQHFKTKSHQRAIEARKHQAQPVDLSRPVLEADYAPDRVHGNPRAVGFRKKKSIDEGRPASAGRSKRHKTMADSNASEFATVDVDTLMSEPACALDMVLSPPNTRGPSGPRDHAAFARSARTMEKMQRVMALAALASRRLAPDGPTVVIETARAAPSKPPVAPSPLSAREIKSVFRGLRFA